VKRTLSSKNEDFDETGIRKLIITPEINSLFNENLVSLTFQSS
jgi:hypothetical protein